MLTQLSSSFQLSPTDGILTIVCSVVQVMVVTLVVRAVGAVFRHLVGPVLGLMVQWFLILLVVLVVIVGVKVVSVEWREEVMVVDWTMVKVSVVADNGAVVVDVVVVVIEVVVAWTVVVVVGMVEGAVYSQEEGEGAGKEEQAQELKHLTVEHIAKIYTQLVVLFYLTFCIASQMSNMNDHTSRP